MSRTKSRIQQLEEQYGHPIGDIVLQTLNITRNKAEACVFLDLDRKTLYGVIKDYSIVETKLDMYKVRRNKNETREA